MPLPPDGRRAEDARATQAAILAAARALFSEQGFFATRVEQIAHRAGVAPATVYAVAGGKQGLISTLVLQWSTTASVVESLDGVAHRHAVEDVLVEVAAGVRRVREEWGDVIDVVLATAPHERTVAEGLERALAIYHAAIRTCAERIVDLVGRGGDVSEIGDVLWFHFGFRGWATLVHDRGWDPDRAQAWLVAQAHHAVREILSRSPGPENADLPNGGPEPELEQ